MSPAPSGAPRPQISDTGEAGTYLDLPTGSPNSWLNPRVLWRSRNDIVARVHDPVDAIREAWLGLQGVPRDGASRAEALRITGFEEREHPSLMVLGDPGEGDASQMAVVPGLVAMSEGVDFSVVCSDVIYPAGEASDYADKFYKPYQGLRGPIYAIPGNHDWYDRLVGFMTHFCDATSAPPAGTGRGTGVKGLLASLLWRKERAIDAATVAAGKALRERDPRFPSQRGPYWTLDAGPIRLVGIDTGIRGCLDAAQGAWLERVSAERPEATKILLTGKPLVVDGKYHAGEIAGSSTTVDDIVRAEEHHYVAAIGGDIHNYQRYPVTLGDGRVMQYLVAGGSGAFMHATHKIPGVDAEDGVARVLREEMDPAATITEAEMHLFPARGWSLYWYAGLLGIGPWRFLGLSRAEAGAVLGKALALEPLDPDGKALRERYRHERMPLRLRLVEKLLYGTLPAPGKLFQRFLSEIVDSNRPPMAKCFLRLDVTDTHLRIRCFQATGWMKDEIDPPLEDEVTIPLVSGPASPP